MIDLHSSRSSHILLKSCIITAMTEKSQSGSVDLLSTNERNSKEVPPASLTNLSHSHKAELDIELQTAALRRM